jgi:hypothetical protein
MFPHVCNYERWRLGLPLKFWDRTPNSLAKTCVQELIYNINQVSLGLELTSPKTGVLLCKTNYLACHTQTSGPCYLHRLIHNSWWQFYGQTMLDPKVLSKFLGCQEEVQMISSTFKINFQHMTSQQTLNRLKHVL